MLSNLAPDIEQAERFLSALDPQAESWCFQTFDDDPDRKDRSLARTMHGTLNECADDLATLNQRGAGVFVTINETDGAGRKAENVTRVRAQFVDFDGAPVDPAIAWGEPHLLVSTSPDKFHAYWRVDGLDLDDFKPGQKALAEAFDGDPAVNDLPRVMRLPGFWHQKGEPYLVKMQQTGAFPVPFGADEWRRRIKPLMPQEAAQPAIRIDTGGHQLADPDSRAVMRDFLAAAPNNLDRNDWAKLAASLKAEWGEDLRSDFVGFSTRYRGAEPCTEQVAERFWDSIEPSKITSAAPAFEMMKQIVGEDAFRAAYRRVGGAPDKPQREPRTTPGDPMKGLLINSRGQPYWNTANAAQVLRHELEWEGVLAFDEFTRAHVLTAPLPGQPSAGFTGRELTDADITSALEWFNRNGFPTATRAVLADAMQMVARDAIINPVRDYLHDLAWDGEPRLGTWLVDYCGAEDNLYTREVGRRWMISAVARALKPGCKADAMLVLEGRQGLGKSTVFRILAGDEWFGDDLPPVTSKDASTYLRGLWIVEIGEMTAVTRSEIESVKAFLSRQEERYRPPYGRVEVSEPRRCIFAGSTNRADYLRDETGNRRFWPVPTPHLDLDALKRDRDQLWAEAVAAFRADEPWWLSGEAEQQAQEVQAERHQDDPWEAEILNHTLGREETCTKEILKCLGFEPGEMGTRDTMRVAGLLQRLGFEKRGKFTSGEWRNCARYVRRWG